MFRPDFYNHEYPSYITNLKCSGEKKIYCDKIVKNIIN